MKCFWLAGLGLWLLAAPPAAYAADAPLPAARKVEKLDASPEQVRAWVRQLDADEFALREQATENLMRCGSDAVQALAALNLEAQNLEVLSRGIHVLQELALAEDLTVEEAARQLLEQLASSKNATASNRAVGTLRTLNEIRQDRTIAQLQELGVRVMMNTTQVGLMLVHEVPTIEIDDNFTGTPEDLKRLKYLQNVRLVQLSGDKITDEVMQRVAELRDLEYLKIKWAKISSRGLEPIANLPRLQHLSVLYSPINDEVIPTLEKIKTLTNVRLYGTEITKTAAQRLNTALGGDGLERRVDHRHGAFLGIGGDRGTRGCEVTIVQANSAAQKAGLQPGDIVVRFADEPIADFEALTLAIGKYKARDTVTFEILRGDTPRKIEVTLGEWDW
jgi:hypothetical protein